MSNSIPMSVMRNNSIPNMQLSYPVYPLEDLSILNTIYGYRRGISMAPNISRYKVKNGKWSLNGGKRRLVTGNSYNHPSKIRATRHRSVSSINARMSNHEN